MELATTQPNPYKLALLSPKVMEMKKGEAMTAINTFLTQTQNASGFDVKQDLKFLCTGVYEEIKTYFYFLRLEELRLAFQNGVRKEYGEFFGLNIVTFNLWIKGFLADQRRKDAKIKLEEENKKPIPPLVSPTEAEYLWKQAMYKQFEDFKATGILKCEFPSYQFEEFKKRGLIKISKSEYEAIWEMAKGKVCELHRLKRLNPKSVKERDNSTRIINQITTNQMSSETEGYVKNEARRQAIEICFKGMERIEL